MVARLCILLAATCGTVASIAAAADDYQLHPALALSLYAKEPDIVDPVALTWDAEGNMYVVEMRDYPYGFGPDRKPGGTVRLLQDTDTDGKPDRSTVFATGLSFPTSVAPWNGGIIVAAPPEIVFLKDTDGDGKADVREVLLKGFVLGVTDSNMNGLRWGLDNRLHGVNGGNGGNVTSTRKPGPAISLRNLDFSFDPRTGDVTPTFHTSGGFGLVFDDWGRSFVTYNINHIQQRMIPARYLERFEGFPPVQAVESISDHDDMSRIYPISEPETRVNHPEQSGHFSSAGGMGYIGSPAFPGDLYGSILVCDVVGNLVHRDVLRPRGPIFVASRPASEKQSEFFASRDRTFRPVGMELGPDGALYLIDMQRDVIEHPDYIPQPVRDKMDLRAGENRGRIHRITPRGGFPPVKPNLRRAPTPELIDHLSHSNAWWRCTAQRLLMERGEQAKDGIAKLKTLATSGKSPLGRLHALWTLAGLNGLDESLLVNALSDREPGVRENALILCERRLGQAGRLRERVLAMADDADARVRFQAALTFGELPSATDHLTRIMLRDVEHRWSRLAVLSSLARDEERVFRSVIDLPGQLNEARQALVRELADLLGARERDDDRLGKFIGALAKLKEPLQIAALEGLQSGLERNASKPRGGRDVALALEKTGGLSTAAITRSWRVAKTLGLPVNESQRRALTNAMKLALDPSQRIALRLENIGLLAFGEYGVIRDAAFALLDGRQSAELQRAAIDVLGQFEDVDLAQRLIEGWRMLAPAARSPVVNLLLQRIAFHGVLIGAMEQGRITVGELNLDLEQRRRLLWESRPELKGRAAKLIGDGEYANRKTIIEDWLKRLPAAGDATRGRAVFEKACAQCHAFGGVGHAVGPDLAALAHRSVEDLLSNILDPNMAINPAYAGYTVETVNGEIESGILQSETHDAVQLLQAQGKKVVLPRTQIKRLQSSGISLMPEGLESGLTPSEVRDVIALLQQRR